MALYSLPVVMETQPPTLIRNPDAVGLLEC